MIVSEVNLVSVLKPTTRESDPNKLRKRLLLETSSGGYQLTCYEKLLLSEVELSKGALRAQPSKPIVIFT